jgi:hypothetical protein
VRNPTCSDPVPTPPARGIPVKRHRGEPGHTGTRRTLRHGGQRELGLSSRYLAKFSTARLLLFDPRSHKNRCILEARKNGPKRAALSLAAIRTLTI